MKIKALILSALAMVAFNATADIKLNIIEASQSLIVKATDSSQPVEGLTITAANVPQLNGKTFVTDENGRVSIPVTLNHSRSVKLEASEQNEKVASKYVFVGQHRD